MKKYNLGNIVLELTIDDTICHHERLDVYESFDEGSSDEFINIL